MRRYTILSITRNIGGVDHVYTAVRNGNEYTGDYVCRTLQNDTKIVSDFICMPNSQITSVKDETRRLDGNLSIFTVGEPSNQGRITGFKPHRNTMEVYLNNARVNTVALNTITKIAAAPAQQPVPAPARGRAVDAVPVGESRSTIANGFAELEAKIIATRDIRLEKLLKTKIPGTLQEFLIKFFEVYNTEKNTIYVDDKTVQTTINRRRSLGDIFKLCKYYYPTCTLAQVVRLLYVTLPYHYERGFRSSYCNTIKKRVWYYSPGNGNLAPSTTEVDEYGHRIDWYTSKI